MKNITSQCYWLLFILAIVPGISVYAEVTLDGTMGAPGSVTGPNYAITDTLGTTVGTNLFHSFSSFNIANTETATFSGSASITNIISRVTGGNTSTIDGQLSSSIAGADFYFINPAGVIFGVNASIDVSGSFNVSTADYISLDGNGNFDAINPAASTLTVDSPTAFGFYAGTPVGIDIGDALLQTQQAKNIFVVGGDITITDGNLYAPDGQVILASVASPGEVSLDSSTLSLNGFQSLGTISISNPSGSYPFVGFGEVGNLDVTTLSPLDGIGGGKIIIKSGNLYLDSGILRADVIDSINGGGISIDTRDITQFSGDSLITSRTQIFTGDSGPIIIQTGSILMRDDVSIISNSESSGNGGTITITADTIQMLNQSELRSRAISDGQGGDILLVSNSLVMSNNSQIISNSFGGGAGSDAGNIVIQANDIQISDDSTINSSSENGSLGASGSVNVTTDSLTMKGESWIISYTETDRNAGTITVNAVDISMHDLSVMSTSTFSNGDGGTVTVNSSNLVLNDSAIITSGTEDSGNAGNVIINADNISINDSAIISSESESGIFFVRDVPDLGGATGGGNGGTVQVNAINVTLKGGAKISSATSGAGASGNVDIVLTNLEINSGSSISAVSDGTGIAGDISVLAANEVQLNNGSITTETINSDGGNITVTATQLIYMLEGVISTSVQGGLGNGGNISIDPVFVILNNSSIIANAFGGNGGNILIVAENFFQDQSSTVQASSNLGVNGNIDIDSPDETVSSSLTEMPDSLLAVSNLVSQQCDIKTRKDISSLVFVGRDGLPPSPNDYVTVRLPIDISDSSKINSPAKQSVLNNPVAQFSKGYKPRELIVLSCR